MPRNKKSIVDLFSQEVIDEIIDWLIPEPNALERYYRPVYGQWTHFEDLKSCSLVCKSFLRRARHHLFSTVRFWDHSLSSRHKLYSTLIKSAPYICSAIRNIYINLGPSENDWVINNKKFLALMSRFLQAEVRFFGISIHGIGTPSKWTHTRTFETEFVKPFIHSQHITYMSLSSQNNIPLSLVSGCRNLTHLRLDCAVPEPDGKFSDITMAECLPKILHLDVSTSGKMVMALCGGNAPRQLRVPLVDFTKLKSLCLRSVEEDDIDAMQNYLNHLCAATVQELHLDIHEIFAPYPYSKSTSRDIDWKRFTALRTLKLDVESIVRIPERGTGNLCDYLAKIPSTNCLTSVSIRAYVFAKERPLPYRYVAVDWGQLDKEIIRLSAGQALKVNISVEFSSFVAPDSVTPKKSALLEAFQRVNASSWIEFELKVKQRRFR